MKQTHFKKHPTLVTGDVKKSKLYPASGLLYPTRGNKDRSPDLRRSMLLIDTKNGIMYLRRKNKNNQWGWLKSRGLS